MLSPKPLYCTARILLVDDDPELCELICVYLERFCISARGVGNGLEMRQALTEEAFDLIVLDLMLPGEDGLSLCRSLRRESGIPIVMLTGRCEPADRIIGLELGADDCVCKPFDPRELVARIQAVLRRAKYGCAQPRNPLRASVSFDGWTLDGVLHQLISPEGITVSLTNVEVRLLWVFIEHPQQALSREFLLANILGRVIKLGCRSIDLQVSRLRSKLGDDPASPKLIKTVRGEGYLFDAMQIK